MLKVRPIFQNSVQGCKMEVEVVVKITVKDKFVKEDPSLIAEVLNEMDYEFTHEAIEDTEIVDYNWEF